MWSIWKHYNSVRVYTVSFYLINRCVSEYCTVPFFPVPGFTSINVWNIRLTYAIVIGLCSDMIAQNDGAECRLTVSWQGVCPHPHLQYLSKLCLLSPTAHPHPQISQLQTPAVSLQLQSPRTNPHRCSTLVHIWVDADNYCLASTSLSFNCWEQASVVNWIGTCAVLIDCFWLVVGTCFQHTNPCL